jgi:hypothetical protein
MPPIAANERVCASNNLVALARVGHEPEGPRGTQQQVRDVHAVVDAAHHQAFFAPVELEGLAELEDQRHESLGGDRLPFALAPRADEVGDAAVAAGITIAFDLRVQRASRAPLVPWAVRVSLERQLERLVVRRELARRFTAPVLRLLQHRHLQPLAHRVSRQTRQPHDLPNRPLLAEIHPPNLANHGHGDHSFSPAQKRGRVG